MTEVTPTCRICSDLRYVAVLWEYWTLPFMDPGFGAMAQSREYFAPGSFLDSVQQALRAKLAVP